MELKILEHDLSICKLKDLSQAGIAKEFFFVAKTDEEISLVCPTKDLPDNALACENGWKAMRIEGVLDFSLIGILSKISSLLADAKIGIFVVSTFNTDYVLTKKDDFDKAIKVLTDAGYSVI